MAQTFSPTREWQTDPKNPDAQIFKNFDNLPEGYRAFLVKEDNYKTEDSTLTEGVTYIYKVKYWENSDTYSVWRVKKKQYSNSGSSSGSGFKGGFRSSGKPQPQYLDVKLCDVGEASSLLKTNRSDGDTYWTCEEKIVKDVKKETINNGEEQLVSFDNVVFLMFLKKKWKPPATATTAPASSTSAK